MNIYAATYNGQIYMLSGLPTNITLRRRNQVSQTSIRSLYLPSNSVELLCGGFDGQLIAVNKNTLQSTKQTKEPKGMINCIEKINDNVVAIGHENGLIRFWDWKSWNLKKQSRQHKKPVRDLKIDPNGAMFCSVASNALILWNTQKYEKVFHYKFDYDIQHVLIDNELKHIFLINSKQIRQIKTQNNEEVSILKLEPTEQSIQSVLLFEGYLIIGGDKGNILVYAVGQYEHKIWFKAHNLRVKCMKIVTYDEMDYLVTASSSGQIAVWDLLQFLKQVQKIGQDYHLEGLQPLSSVNLDRRVISIEASLISTEQQSQSQKQKEQPVQKVKNTQKPAIKAQKGSNNNSNDTKPGKKLPKQPNQTQNPNSDILKQKKIEKKNKKLLLLKKLQQKKLKSQKQ